MGIKSPVQVYRAVKKLIENGAVHRVESLNAFVLCASPHAHGRAIAVLAASPIGQPQDQQRSSPNS